MSPNASKSGRAAVSRNRVEKRPQAITDLADIAVFLAEESGSDEPAFRFLTAADGFPNYLIFYRPVESGIEIIRVLHAKRDIDLLLGGWG